MVPTCTTFVLVAIALVLATSPLTAQGSCPNRQVLGTDGYTRTPSASKAVAANKMLYMPLRVSYVYEGFSVASISAVLRHAACSGQECSGELVMGLYNSTGNRVAQTAATTFNASQSRQITVTLSPKFIIPNTLISELLYLALSTNIPYKIKAYADSGNLVSYTYSGALPSTVTAGQVVSELYNAALAVTMCL